MSGLPWFRVDREIGTSHKLVELEERIGPAALAHVMKLFCEVASHRADGSLVGLSDVVIEKWAHWVGERGALVAALRETGWIRDDVVHGWAERQGALAAKFERDRERPFPRSRPRTGQDEDAPHGAPRTGGPARNETERNVTEQDFDREGVQGPDVVCPPPSAPTPAPVVESEPDVSAIVTNVAQKRRGFTGRGVLAEDEQRTKPKTPDALHERMRHLRDGDGHPRWPALDGKQGRPTLLERVQALWPNWSGHYDTAGPAVAFAKLCGWLSDDNDKHMRARRVDEKNDPRTVTASGEAERTRRQLREREEAMKREGFQP